MIEHTPTPWVAGDSEHGIYPIWAKCGPLDVQPATAHGSDDAAFIVKAVNSHDALVAVEKAARNYFMYAIQDEANERECCVDDEQHRRAIALKDALASIKDRL